MLLLWLSADTKKEAITYEQMRIRKQADFLNIFLSLLIPFVYKFKEKQTWRGVIRGGVRRGTHTAYHRIFSPTSRNHRKINKPRGEKNFRTGKNDLMFSHVALQDNTQDASKCFIIIF